MNVYLLWSQAAREKEQKSQNNPQDGRKLTDIPLLGLNTEHLDARTDIPNFMKICAMVDLLIDYREADMVST
jgi:hypothetical protein